MINRIKVVIWGINDGIWKDIQNCINPFNVEIVAFIDNDVMKQGANYGGIPVISPKEFDEKKVDYIIVAALSAYEKVENQLKEMGVASDKIQIYATEKLCNYRAGKVGKIDRSLLEKIYFRPESAFRNLRKYEKIYDRYAETSLKCMKGDEWFLKSEWVSHALGGIVNGKKMMYSNSKEAFEYSMNAGFKILECDILGKLNGEWLLGHDYFRCYEAEQEGYTMLTLCELLHMLAENSEVSCLFDIKWDIEEDYFACVDAIEEMIKMMKIGNERKQRLKEQIILEVYNEVTIQYACKNKYKMFFTQYRNPERYCFMNTVNLCDRYGINVIGMWPELMLSMKKFLQIILDKGIKIFVFSTDSIEESIELRKLGASGIFTNYIMCNGSKSV